ncbi:MAG: hypothetical protein C0412_01245 [Flavobacterium sp.]|nr:hypothetical protein [Flavobacterium sp.]
MNQMLVSTIKNFFGKNKLVVFFWQCFLYLWFFLLVYSPRFAIFPMDWTKLLLILIAPVFLVKHKKLGKTIIKKDVAFIMVFPILIFIIIGLLTSYTLACDYSLALMFFLPPPLLCFMSWAWVQLYFEKVNATFLSVLAAIGNIAFIQSTFLIFDGFYPPVKNFFAQILIRGNTNIYADSFRPSGLSVRSGDSLGIIQALGGICVLYLLWNEKETLFNLFKLITISLSCFLVARTGIALLCIYCVFQFFMFSGRKHFLKNIVFATILASLLFAIFWNFSLSTEKQIQFREKIIPWGLVLFYSYSETGSFTSSEVLDTLWAMMFLPDSEREVWIGNGYYTDPNNGLNAIPSDNGYVRTIFAAGFIGTFAILAYYVCFLLTWLRYSSSRANSKFVIGVWLILFIAQFKIPILYYGMTQAFIWALFWALVFSRLRHYNDFGEITESDKRKFLYG